MATQYKTMPAYPFKQDGRLVIAPYHSRGAMHLRLWQTCMRYVGEEWKYNLLSNKPSIIRNGVAHDVVAPYPGAYNIEKMYDMYAMAKIVEIPEREDNGQMKLDAQGNPIIAGYEIEAVPIDWGSGRYKQCLEAHINEHTVHPFADLVESARKKFPNADENAHRYLIEDHFDIYPADRFLAEEGSSLLLKGLIARDGTRAVKYDIVLVLVGPQGAGKSSFFQNMLPETMFSDSPRFGEKIKDFVESTDGLKIVEIPEIAGMHAADIAKIKSEISVSQDHIRRAYRQDASTTFRQFCVVSTTNESSPLPNDPSGNRRWLAIRVKAKMPVKEMVESLKAKMPMYLSSVCRFREAHPDQAAPMLPEGVLSMQARSNERYRNVDETVEQLIDLIGYEKPIETHEVIAAVNDELNRGRDEKDRKEFDATHRGVSNRFSDGLRNCGWRRLRGSPTADGKRPYQWHHPNCDCGNKVCSEKPDKGDGTYQEWKAEKQEAMPEPDAPESVDDAANAGWSGEEPAVDEFDDSAEQAEVGAVVESAPASIPEADRPFFAMSDDDLQEFAAWLSDNPDQTEVPMDAKKGLLREINLRGMTWNKETKRIESVKE